MNLSVCGNPIQPGGKSGDETVNSGFWKNRNILITGFEGFLGSNLARALLSADAVVTGLDIKTFRKETILCDGDYRKIKVYKGSVANHRLMRDILFRHSIEIIFHLAAEAIVGKSEKKPLKTFETNIKGTWTVLESAREYDSIKSVIVASSDKAYGCHERLPYCEDAPLKGSRPYDVSKSCGDLIACAYADTYDLPVAITRCGNIFGPGDYNFSRLIPDAVRCALSGKKLLIRSDGNFTRDYVYVDDIVKGYILLAEKLNKLKLTGEAFNFSNDKPVSVLQVIDEISNVVGAKLQYQILDIACQEIRHQYLNSEKSKKVLKWSPDYTFSEGIRKTIEWFKSSSGADREPS